MASCSLHKEQTSGSTIIGSASHWLIQHITGWDLRMYNLQVMRHISRHFCIATDLISQTGFRWIHTLPIRDSFVGRPVEWNVTAVPHSIINTSM